MLKVNIIYHADPTQTKTHFIEESGLQYLEKLGTVLQIVPATDKEVDELRAAETAGKK